MYANQPTITTVVAGQPGAQHIVQPGVQPVHYNHVFTTNPTSRVININAIKGLSIAQLIIGILSIGLGTAVYGTLSMGYWLVDVSGGIWGGIIIIITGIFGILLSKDSTSSCLVNSTLAFNIISFLVAITDGILFLAGTIDLSNCGYYYDNYSYSYNYDYYCVVPNSQTGTALFGLSMTLMAAEFFLALITAICCCRGCCGTTNTGVVIQQPYPYYGSTTAGSGQQYPVLVSSPGSTPNHPYYHGQYNQQQPPYTNHTAPYAASNLTYSERPSEKEPLLGGNEPSAPATEPPPYSQ